MDEAFIDALLEEMMNGNHPDGTFSIFAYDNVVHALKISFGPHITKQHLKNSKKTLSQRFAELYDLFNGLSGFSWSPVTKLFEAESQIWKDLIEKKPHARKWMITPVLHYDKLYELFGADRATGKYAESAKDKIKWWEKDCTDLNDSFEGATMYEVDLNLENGAANLPANMDSFSPTCANSNQSIGTASSRGHKRKAAMIDTIEKRCEKMTLGIKELADVMRDGNSLHDKSISLSERQVVFAEKQAEIAEKSLTILEKSRPRHYRERKCGQNLKKLEYLKNTN